MRPSELAREHERAWRQRADAAARPYTALSAEKYSQAMYSAEAIAALADQLEQQERKCC